ncbi:complex 1 protein-domain-containing protein [Polychytrium aggregatum]|uniref:complex 1 protein-domain-containing protein n=1 Tax=Polychytrium aggregatum TaxID=110093 RepID=UPI0022FEAB83|nr:complex 1 protein-domain-containing protein [Polychytrium aggregatum]KAI9204680.1 complex 1 protein-domain-containing protein [Polychytrium aggregatum]
MAVAPALIPRLEVLQLYRSLLKASRTLKFTSREYYVARMRQEFRKNQNVQDPSLQSKLFKKGRFLLENDLGGLL